MLRVGRHLCDIWELQHLSELYGYMTFEDFWRIVCPRLGRNSAERRWERWKARLPQYGLPIERVWLPQKQHTDKFGQPCANNGNGEHGRAVLRLSWSKTALDDYLTYYERSYWTMDKRRKAAERIKRMTVINEQDDKLDLADLEMVDPKPLVCGHPNKHGGRTRGGKSGQPSIRVPKTCQHPVPQEGQRCWRHNGNKNGARKNDKPATARKKGRTNGARKNGKKTVKRNGLVQIRPADLPAYVDKYRLFCEHFPKSPVALFIDLARHEGLCL